MFKIKNMKNNFRFVFVVLVLLVLFAGCSSTNKKTFIETKRNSVIQKNINDYGELVVPPFLLEEYKEGKVEIQ